MCVQHLLSGTVHDFGGSSFYCHEEQPTRWVEHTHPQIQVALLLSDASAQASWHSATGRQHQRQVDAGQVCIIPDCQSHAFTWQHKAELMLFYFHPAFLAQAAQERVSPDTIELVEQYGIEDVALQHLCAAFRAAFQPESDLRRLYVDALMQGLAVYLLDRYSTARLQQLAPQVGLSRHQLKQIVEYIETHLHQNIRLAELADEVELSQWYFCRLFKQSIGVSPYRYVLEQRIERAKTLLSQYYRDISEIALQCGFSNQSHFTLNFRKVTGMTPKVYQKQC